MLQNKELAEQLQALLEGRLARVESERLEQLVTSDPAAARAYADAKLRLARGRDPGNGAACHSVCEEGPSGEGSQEASASSKLLHKLCRLFGAGRS